MGGPSRGGQAGRHVTPPRVVGGRREGAVPTGQPRNACDAGGRATQIRLTLGAKV